MHVSCRDLFKHRPYGIIVVALKLLVLPIDFEVVVRRLVYIRIARGILSTSRIVEPGSYAVCLKILFIAIIHLQYAEYSYYYWLCSS